MDAAKAKISGMKGKKDEDANAGLMYKQLRKFINVIDELRDVGL
jgi:hypothetical protein